MKTGWQTTEFWLTAGAIVVALLLASGVFGEASVVYKALSFAASALATMGYSYGRSLTKAAEMQSKALVEAAKEKAPSPPSS